MSSMSVYRRIFGQRLLIPYQHVDVTLVSNSILLGRQGLSRGFHSSLPSLDRNPLNAEYPKGHPSEGVGVGVLNTDNKPRLPEGESLADRCNPRYEDSVASETGSFISKLSHMGYTVGDIRFIGPVLFFNHLQLLWRVTVPNDITPASLALVPLMVPRVDMLIVGTGDHFVPLRDDTKEFLRLHKIPVEVVPSRVAAGTFNFMRQEGRIVAAALLTPSYDHMNTSNSPLEKTILRALNRKIQHDNLPYKIRDRVTDRIDD